MIKWDQKQRKVMREAMNLPGDGLWNGTCDVCLCVVAGIKPEDLVAVERLHESRDYHIEAAARAGKPAPLPERGASSVMPLDVAKAILLLDKMADATEAAGVTNELFPEAFKRLKGTAQTVVCLKTANPGVGIKSLEGCCCCDCRFHHEDHSHPMTDGGRVTHVRGWICGGSEMGWYSGWGEHGLCECHEKREKK